MPLKTEDPEIDQSAFVTAMDQLATTHDNFADVSDGDDFDDPEGGIVEETEPGAAPPDDVSLHVDTAETPYEEGLDEDLDEETAYTADESAINADMADMLEISRYQTQQNQDLQAELAQLRHESRQTAQLVHGQARLDQETAQQAAAAMAPTLTGENADPNAYFGLLNQNQTNALAQQMQQGFAQMQLRSESVAHQAAEAHAARAVEDSFLRAGPAERAEFLEAFETSVSRDAGIHGIPSNTPQYEQLRQQNWTAALSLGARGRDLGVDPRVYALEQVRALYGLPAQEPTDSPADAFPSAPAPTAGDYANRRQRQESSRAPGGSALPAAAQEIAKFVPKDFRQLMDKRRVLESKYGTTEATRMTVSPKSNARRRR